MLIAGVPMLPTVEPVRMMEPLCGWGEEHEEHITAAMNRRKTSR